MSQPSWKTVYTTDYSRLQTDTTGVYPPELEIAEEFFEDAGRTTKFRLYRFPLERMKTIPDEKTPGKVYIVPDKYEPSSYPHPIEEYEGWFVDSLPDVARSHGMSVQELVDSLCSSDPGERSMAYEAIGSENGYENFDEYPQILTEAKLNKRWKK